VGPEGFCGGCDDTLPDTESVLGIDLDGKREILFVGTLDHSRDTDKIDLIREGKPAGDGGTRQDEDVDVRVPQIGSDCHGPAYVSETIGIVGIH
jgi:hypothetical protein